MLQEVIPSSSLMFCNKTNKAPIRSAHNGQIGKTMTPGVSPGRRSQARVNRPGQTICPELAAPLKTRGSSFPGQRQPKTAKDRLRQARQSLQILLTLNSTARDLLTWLTRRRSFGITLFSFNAHFDSAHLERCLFIA